MRFPYARRRVTNLPAAQTAYLTPSNPAAPPRSSTEKENSPSLRPITSSELSRTNVLQLAAAPRSNKTIGVGLGWFNGWLSAAKTITPASKEPLAVAALGWSLSTSVSSTTNRRNCNATHEQPIIMKDNLI